MYITQKTKIYCGAILCVIGMMVPQFASAIAPGGIIPPIIPPDDPYDPGFYLTITSHPADFSMDSGDNHWIYWSISTNTLYNWRVKVDGVTVQSAYTTSPNLSFNFAKTVPAGQQQTFLVWLYVYITGYSLSKSDYVYVTVYGPLDSDGDGISDSIEGTGNPDGDEYPNYLDTDSDDDLILDEIEGNIHSDTDGVPNFLDDDSDNDGILDLYEGNDDSTDNDGKPNYIDDDSDNDGILDEIEGTDDSTDNDGKPNYIDDDSDNDGILDLYEGNDDSTDNDGKPNYIDDDSDNDGILDEIEGNDDSTDNDGKPNYIDEDSDNDGILDIIEGNIHSDSDGVPDYLDDDSDNDGILDEDEIDLGTDPTDADSDGDGLTDFDEISLYLNPNDNSDVFIHTENFDTVPLGSLPSGWTTDDPVDVGVVSSTKGRSLKIYNNQVLNTDEAVYALNREIEILQFSMNVYQDFGTDDTWRIRVLDSDNNGFDLECHEENLKIDYSNYGLSSTFDLNTDLLNLNFHKIEFVLICYDEDNGESQNLYIFLDGVEIFRDSLKMDNFFKEIQFEKSSLLVSDYDYVMFDDIDLLFIKHPYKLQFSEKDSDNSTMASNKIVEGLNLGPGTFQSFSSVRFDSLFGKDYEGIRVQGGEALFNHGGGKIYITSSLNLHNNEETIFLPAGPIVWKYSKIAKSSISIKVKGPDGNYIGGDTLKTSSNFQILLYNDDQYNYRDEFKSVLGSIEKGSEIVEKADDVIQALYHGNSKIAKVASSISSVVSVVAVVGSIIEGLQNYYEISDPIQDDRVVPEDSNAYECFYEFGSSIASVYGADNFCLSAGIGMNDLMKIDYHLENDDYKVTAGDKFTFEITYRFGIDYEYRTDALGESPINRNRFYSRTESFTMKYDGIDFNTN
ncbi:hypothetical protein [Candidatus Lokiarchaeum ossiferum]|uniref:hypothetical protein n=1 Tax=Candidatus Lokiarchaeum ossiferum TaxID=2951803 RepID=UPI00352D630A